MATLSMLRQHLRGDIGDIVRISGAREFENEYLERALFEGLQQHNRTYSWATLPPEEEQLVLLLAKAKLCWDTAVTYAHDPKMQFSQGTRDKVANASVLQSLAKDLRAEYQATLALITADPDEGEVYMGTLVRTDYGTRQQLPAQAATRPPKPVLFNAQYIYDPNLGGRVYWQWDRFTNYDIAFIQVLLGKQNPVTTYNGSVIRTLYDVGGEPMAVPTIPPLQQQEAYVDYTILPTGRYYLAMAAWSWNRLYSLSDSIPLDVENYIDIPADTYVMVTGV